MRRALCLLLLSASLASGCKTFAPMKTTTALLAPPKSIYEIASQLTGCPVAILRGYHFAESSYGANLDHPDPYDVGDFALHERAAYHKERARRYGEYNARNPLDSAIIAGRLYVSNLAALGNREDAIAAFKQGREGVRLDGRVQWYVDRVLGKRS